jgi:hypothetical protein
MIPVLSKAIVRKTYRLGGYSAALLTGAESSGPIRYLFVLAVVKDGETTPCYFVTSEINTLQGEMLAMAAKNDPDLRERLAKGHGSPPFLGVFEQDGSHSTLDSSDDWKDINKFAAKAVELASKKVGFSGAPVEDTDSFRGTSARGFNTKQLRVLAFTAAGLVLMILFPPVYEHILTGSSQGTWEITGHAGYKFLFNIGEDNSQRHTESINILLLFFQCVVVVAAGVVVAFLLKSRR